MKDKRALHDEQWVSLEMAFAILDAGEIVDPRQIVERRQQQWREIVERGCRTRGTIDGETVTLDDLSGSNIEHRRRSFVGVGGVAYFVLRRRDAPDAYNIEVERKGLLPASVNVKTWIAAEVEKMTTARSIHDGITGLSNELHRRMVVAIRQGQCSTKTKEALKPRSIEIALRRLGLWPRK